MILAEGQRERELVERLVSTLRRMPNVAAAQVSSREAGVPGIDTGIDVVIDASIRGKPVRLLVEAKNTVFPRDVRAAYWNLRSISNRPQVGSAPVIPMIVADTISGGAKQLLQSERIGYFDGEENLFLANDDLYVLIDKPVTKASRKIDRPLFSGSRSQVIHALLLHPQHWFSTEKLAALVLVSRSTVSVVLGELEKRDLINVQGKGPNKTRQLAHPGALLDEWAKHLSLQPKPEIRRYYVPLVNPEELMKRLDDVCKRQQTAYVITHEWAAQLYTPYLSNIPQVRCRIFPNVALSAITTDLNARQVEEGSNLGVIESDSVRDMLFEQNIRGLRVESPILAYLDLIEGKGRAREMAEHLRGEQIGF